MKPPKNIGPLFVRSRLSRWSFFALILGFGFAGFSRLRAIEIPLEGLTPVRIGYIDLQRVFDTYPEKSFAEGDLLREIEKRKRELGHRQADINTLRQQIAADDDALSRAKLGQPVMVPANAIPEPAPEPVKAPPPPAASTATVVGSTTPVVEPYPTEDPLAGLPGHEAAPAANTAMPGMQGTTAPTPSELDLLASATGPVLLSPSQQNALEKRIDKDRRALSKAVSDFKNFRGNAVDDMKQLQTQKTYGVMAKIYAVLQDLARDEGITVVLDKAYVLYGEDTVDLSDKLITRLQAGEQ